MIEIVGFAGLWRVHADRNQLELAILNLAINARDAMTGEGKLTIEMANTFLDRTYAEEAGVEPGQFVVVSVSDTGRGMSREVLDHAFDPFFTTKDVGHGTGLGLSQVYGFVKQSGGHVKIYTEVGQGTTVKVYLPRLSGAEAVALETAESPAPPAEGQKVVLVVEDDEGVRRHTVDMLRELGYSVVEAPHGRLALDILEAGTPVDLLFTDVGLPGGMNGRQLADAALSLRPELPVLFTTGYARNAIVHDGRLDPGVHLLPKPFTYAELGRSIAAAVRSDGA